MRIATLFSFSRHLSSAHGVLDTVPGPGQTAVNPKNPHSHLKHQQIKPSLLTSVIWSPLVCPLLILKATWNYSITIKYLNVLL